MSDQQLSSGTPGERISFDATFSSSRTADITPPVRVHRFVTAAGEHINLIGTNSTLPPSGCFFTDEQVRVTWALVTDSETRVDKPQSQQVESGSNQSVGDVISMVEEEESSHYDATAPTYWLLATDDTTIVPYRHTSE